MIKVTLPITVLTDFGHLRTLTTVPGNIVMNFEDESDIIRYERSLNSIIQDLETRYNTAKKVLRIIETQKTKTVI